MAEKKTPQKRPVEGKAIIYPEAGKLLEQVDDHSAHQIGLDLARASTRPESPKEKLLKFTHDEKKNKSFVEDTHTKLSGKMMENIEQAAKSSTHSAEPALPIEVLTKQDQAPAPKPAAASKNEPKNISPKPTGSETIFQQEASLSVPAEIIANVQDNFSKPLTFKERLKAKRVLAIDIDNDKLRYLVGNRIPGRLQVIKFGDQKFPTEQVNRYKALQIGLENVVSRHYKKNMELNISIFSNEFKIRQVALPKMKNRRDLENALLNKNMTELQNFTEQSIWSYKIVDEYLFNDIPTINVLIVVAPDEVLNKYMQVFSDLALDITRFIPRPVSLHAAYNAMVDSDKTNIIIDFAYDITQICLIRNRNIEFIRNVSIGARNLEVMIHDDKGGQTRMDQTELASVVVESAGTGALSLKERLHSRINELQNKQNPVLHTFFSEILRSLAFFQGKENKNFVETIYLTGYAIRKESLVPYLKNRLQIPIYLMAPRLSDSESKRLEFGEFTSTIGTAVYKENDFNFLPERYKTKQLFSKLNSFLLIIFFFTLAGAGYLSYLQHKIINKTQNLTITYQKEYDRLNPIEGMYNDFIGKIQSVNSENSELRGFVRERPPIIEVMKYLSNEVPQGIRLEKIDMINLIELEDKKKKKKIEPVYKYQIELEGDLFTENLMSDVNLFNFINRLSEAGYFKQVELLNKNKYPEEKRTHFALRLYL